jgi:hypothetical protein
VFKDPSLFLVYQDFGDGRNWVISERS